MSQPQVSAIRILLVDDHAVVRAGLRMLIESRPGFTVIGEAANGSEAQTVATREQPDIILLDYDLGPDNGLDVLPKLLAATQARVILLTGMRDSDIHVQAVRVGAMGVVLKDEAADVLVNAIEKVHRGEAWLDPTLTARVLGRMGSAPRPAERDPEAAKIASLTEREREVIALLAQGMQNKEVGQHLHIADNTVRRHLVAIFEKLGVESRLELVIYAFRHGLAKPGR